MRPSHSNIFNPELASFSFHFSHLFHTDDRAARGKGRIPLPIGAAALVSFEQRVIDIKTVVEKY